MTPPPCFWPKVKPKGLSTSTSMFFAEAVRAAISSPARFLTLLILLILSATKELNTTLFAS